MKIATYRRVSSATQTGDNRYGLDKQQADLDAFVAAGGHEVVATFEDLGASGAGKTLNRPGLLALLAAAASGAFEAVVVPAWDRLARDHVLDGYVRYTLAQHGVSVLSATQSNDVSPEALFTQAILAAVAALERPMLKAKLLGARYAKRARGGYIGGAAPYGTFAQAGSKVLHRNDAEFAILCEMKSMRDSGSTLQQIVDALNAVGRKPRHGGIWRPGTVQTALCGYDRASRLTTEATPAA
jgi:site-specific DNA recombinase